MALSTTQYGYIIDPMVPFTDDKGKTIKNGFVRVFVAGSSTPVVTYRNFDGATNQDLIELDNSGRTKTSVIGSKGLTYKVCVYDAFHSQESPILTVDKVSVIGANITAGAGSTVVTGLDGLTTKPGGFVDASVVGTDGYVALDHTLVDDDLDTDAKVSAVEDDRYIPLLNEDVSDPDSKMTLGRMWQWVLGKIKSLSTTITAFRTGDVIPVDGPSGTAKMSKDDLLRETAENALNGYEVTIFDPAQNYSAGKNVLYNQKKYTFVVDHTAGVWKASDVMLPENQKNGIVVDSAYTGYIAQRICEGSLFRNGDKVSYRLTYKPGCRGSVMLKDTSNNTIATLASLWSASVTDRVYEGSFYVPENFGGIDINIISNGFEAKITNETQASSSVDDVVQKVTGKIVATSVNTTSGGAAIGVDLVTAESINHYLGKEILVVGDSADGTTRCDVYYSVGGTNTRVGILAVSSDLTDATPFTLPNDATRIWVYVNQDFTGTIRLQLCDADSLPLAYGCENFASLDGRVTSAETEITNLKNAVADVRDYSKMTAVRVAGDGSMDYSTIQDAINSITDASVEKQYVIYVYTDFRIQNPTDLWLVWATSQHAPASPNQQCCLFTTKDYVHVVGVGKRELAIKMPNTLSSSCYQYVQVCYAKGNVNVENFEMVIEGGRYALHQESSGSHTSMDFGATTNFINCDFIHKGNVGYPAGSWGSTFAMASGTCSGLKVTYENCKFIAEAAYPFYFHTNSDFDEESVIRLINCKSLITKSGSTLNDWYCRIEDIGSHNLTRLIIENSDLKKIVCGAKSSSGKELTLDDTNRSVRNTGVKVCGSTKFKLTANQTVTPQLRLTANNVNENVYFVGGTAYSAIWGATYKKYPATSDSKCILLGSEFIPDPSSIVSNPSQVLTLAHRLGNCADNSKTLIVNVGGVEQTITFDQNFVTADGSAYTYNTVPAYTNGQVITFMNNQLTGAAFSRFSFNEYNLPDSHYIIAKNGTTASWGIGALLKRDYVSPDCEWRLAQEGEIAECICLEPTPQGCVGKIGIVKKLYIYRETVNIWSDLTVGRLFGCGADGALKNVSSTPELAVMKCIDTRYCEGI